MVLTVGSELVFKLQGHTVFKYSLSDRENKMNTGRDVK